MATEYRVDVENFDFTPLQYKINDYYKLHRVEAANTPGDLTLDLPMSYLDNPFHLDKSDLVLCVMERVDGKPWRLSRQTKWLVIRVEIVYEQGRLLLRVSAKDFLGLLLRRCVPYYASSTTSGYAGQSQSNLAAGFADNMIKAIIRTNLGTTATDYTQASASSLTPVRSLDNTLFTVDPDTSEGASVGPKAIAWRNGLVGPCQELAATSAQLGTYLAYDFLWVNGIMTFRTFVGQRGQDRTAATGLSPVILSPENGLSEAHMSYDFENEVNSVYSGGSGEGNYRIIQKAYSSNRATRNPWALRELFVDTRHNGLQQAAVLAQAQASLRKGRPFLQFSGKVSETDKFRYGLDGNVYFGDVISASFYGYQIDCRIEQVTTDAQPEQPAQHELNLRNIVSV